MIDGKVQGYFLLGENPAVGSAQRPDAAARPGRPGLAGGARPGPDRDGHVLAGRPGDRDRRAAHRGHRHRGLLPARRRAHREGRHVHQHPAAAAVAPQGGRAAGRRAQRPVVRLPPRPPDPRRSWPARTDPRWTGRCSTSPGTTRSTGRGEPTRRGGAARDQRLRTPTGGRCRRYTELKDDGSTACGCWIYCGVLRRRRQPGRAAQAGPGAELGGAGVGLGLAGEPADPLQPRLGRSRRQAVERAQGATSGGTRTQGRWTGHDVAGLRRRPRRRPTGRPDGARRSRTRSRGDDPFIMQADGKGWLFAPAGLLDGPLPAHYEPQESPVAQPALRAAAQPGPRRSSGTATEPAPAVRPRTRLRGLPVRRSPPTGSPSTTPPAA